MASNLKPFLASKIGSVYSFQACSGTFFFVFVSMEFAGNWKAGWLDAQGLVLNDGFAGLRLIPASHKAGKSPG